MDKDYRNITSEEIEHFIPYLRGHIAKRYSCSGDLKEELFSAGLEGTAEGIRRFNPEKKVPRDYWVQRYAAHYMLNAWKGLMKESEERKEQAERAAEIAPAETTDPVTLAENEEILGLALASLTPKERAVIEAVYREGLSLRGLARRMGVNVDVVFRLHRRGLKKMKKAAGAEE